MLKCVFDEEEGAKVFGRSTVRALRKPDAGPCDCPGKCGRADCFNHAASDRSKLPSKERDVSLCKGPCIAVP